MATATMSWTSFSQISKPSIHNIDTCTRTYILPGAPLETPPPSPPHAASFAKSTFHNDTIKSLSTHDLANPVVAVIGVGYVGQHLAEGFGARCPVLAFDISQTRLDDMTRNGVFSHCADVTLTSNPQDLAAATHYLVSVPTILKEDKSIDTRHIESALATIASVCRPGSVVVVESSVAVGMTRRLLQTLSAKGVLGGMSPERVDPGRTFPALETVPKIISGLTDLALYEIERLYTRVFDTLVKVSSPEVAEMTKLYENCQRMINIAYANEMADAAYSIGLDPYEVAAAAATKPYGFTPYTPGLGVGGHCIPCNPSYLFSSLDFPLLRQASEAMWNRPTRIAKETITRHATTSSKQQRVLTVGMGFKAGQSHLMNSPGLQFARDATMFGASVAWVDPLVKQEQVPDLPKWGADKASWSVLAIEANFDLVVVNIKQIQLDYSVLLELEQRGNVKVDWRIEKSKIH